MACKGKSKVPSCAGCMEQLQERHVDAMERRGETIRNPPNPELPSEKRARLAKGTKKKRKPIVVGKRVV